MAKRKPSKSQRDKEKIAAAKYLKAQGLLSKQTKLHGGKYISRGVLKKVNELEWVAKNHYKAVPQKPDFIERAKAHGMLTAKSGRKQYAIVPPNPVEVKRAKRGIVSGVVPVPGGQIYTVELPYSTLSDFTRALGSGEVDNFKNPKEHFAFSYFGNMSRRSFKSGKDLREWLQRYDFVEWIGDENMSSEMSRAMAHFTLYRMIPGAFNPADFEVRRDLKYMRREARHAQQDRRVEARRNKRISEISASAAERRRAADRERKKAERERVKLYDPEKYRREIEAAKKRSTESRNRRKPK